MTHAATYPPGQIVKALREAAGVPSGSLAERVGIHHTALSQIENGHRDCPLDMFTTLLATIDVMSHEHRARYEQALAQFGLRPGNSSQYRQAEREGAVA